MSRGCKRLLFHSNLPIPMISVDIIPMMLNVKLAYRIFGLFTILGWRRADCVPTFSLFCQPLHPHPIEHHKDINRELL